MKEKTSAEKKTALIMEHVRTHRTNWYAEVFHLVDEVTNLRKKLEEAEVEQGRLNLYIEQLEDELTDSAARKGK